MICKHCGKEIHKGEVWNPDENGNGYHHKCLIDMEFDENEAYLKDLKNRSITIPKGATNGDMIKTMFPDLVNSNLDLVDVLNNAKSWWDAPYKKEVAE